MSADVVHLGDPELKRALAASAIEALRETISRKRGLAQAWSSLAMEMDRNALRLAEDAEADEAKLRAIEERFRSNLR